MKLRNYGQGVEVKVRHVRLNGFGLPSFDVDRFVRGGHEEGLHIAMQPHQARSLGLQLLTLAAEAEATEYVEYVAE